MRGYREGKKSKKSKKGKGRRDNEERLEKVGCPRVSVSTDISIRFFFFLIL